MLYTVAEYVALAPIAPLLPTLYRHRLAQVVDALAGYGLSPQAALDVCRTHLVDGRGMTSASADVILAVVD
jgi:hypothetical protein